MQLTYSGSLLLFIGPPLILLMIIYAKDMWNQWLSAKKEFSWLPILTLFTHILLAVAYTTPWDNYLVATRVWWYDIELVSGITFGYVPIEEYTFFVLQTLLTGLGVLIAWRRIGVKKPSLYNNKTIRNFPALLIAVSWFISTCLLIFGENSLNYLTLIMSWALLPVFVQVYFGGDILWANRKLLFLAISLPTFYLWIMDAASINAGIWTISPSQTTGLGIGSLPIEEMLFFFMTNVIIIFGMTLMLSPESRVRFKQFLIHLPFTSYASWLKIKNV